jgi:hypothetical protein
MKKTIRQYRNINDFRFGCFTVRTGSAWMEINGRLKKTGKQTRFMTIEFEHGKGANQTIMIDEEE